MRATVTCTLLMGAGHCNRKLFAMIGRRHQAAVWMHRALHRQCVFGWPATQTIQTAHRSDLVLVHLRARGVSL